MHEVLVLAPHVDDESLGCGGTIAKLVGMEKHVKVVAFSKAEVSLPEGYTREDITREFFMALKALGCVGHVMNLPTRNLGEYRQDILDIMVELRKNRQPDLVICPSSVDTHQDHRVVAEEAVRAFWDKSILGFESVRKCKAFNPQVYVPLEARHLDRKLEAIRCYKSQVDKPMFPGRQDYVMSQARLRGLQIGEKYAEVFECVQMRM